jgi:hypothetical protein
MSQALLRQAMEALDGLMEVEKRGRLMPFGREWDAARAALSALSCAVEALQQREAGSGWQWVPKEPTPEMIGAYLTANDAYWKRTDELPKHPAKWRNGTPFEATAESYRAMLASAPSPEEKQEGEKETPGNNRERIDNEERKLWAASALSLAASPPQSLYLGGPYPDGSYAICETGSGRVVQRLGVEDFPPPLRDAAMRLAADAQGKAGATGFSEFFRNATPERKAEVFGHVMAEVAKQQQAVIDAALNEQGKQP